MNSNLSLLNSLELKQLPINVNDLLMEYNFKKNRLIQISFMPIVSSYLGYVIMNSYYNFAPQVPMQIGIAITITGLLLQIIGLMYPVYSKHLSITSFFLFFTAYYTVVPHMVQNNAYSFLNGICCCYMFQLLLDPIGQYKHILILGSSTFFFLTLFNNINLVDGFINIFSIYFFCGAFFLDGWFQSKYTNNALTSVAKFYNELLKKAKVEEQLEAKDQINKYKGRIISSIGHDLKTPISAALNYCYNLKNVTKLEEKNKIINIIEDQLFKSAINAKMLMLLAGMVSNCAFAKVNVACFYASSAMTKVCKMLEKEAEGKNNKIYFISDEKFRIFNDHERFIFLNYILISNAITHTCNGTITIDMKNVVEVKKEEEKVKYIEVSIKDTGCGMTKDTATQLNNLIIDNQITSSANNSLQGGFIGLTNAIQFLKTISPNEFNLKVASMLGVGTELIYRIYQKHPDGKYIDVDHTDPTQQQTPIDDFSMDFGLDQPISTGGAMKISLQNNSFFNKFINEKILKSLSHIIEKISLKEEEYTSLKVMVVDDVFFNVESLSVMLKSLGIEKQEKFVSSSAALEFLRTSNGSVDIIFTDYQMPELNGYELISKARNEKLINKCRVILVSAADIIKDQFENGVFDSIMSKPYAIKEVFQEILKYFQNPKNFSLLELQQIKYLIIAVKYNKIHFVFYEAKKNFLTLSQKSKTSQLKFKIC